MDSLFATRHSSTLASCLILSLVDGIAVARSIQSAPSAHANLALSAAFVVVGVVGSVLVALRAVRRGAVRLGQRVPGAAFLGHVHSVVALRSEKQVIRVTARRIVAFVKSEQTVGYGAVVDFPGHAVGRQERRSSCSASDKPSVPAPAGASPHPACRHQDKVNGSVLVDLRPKAFFESLHSSLNITSRIFPVEAHHG
jgi:hypothetical protein